MKTLVLALLCVAPLLGCARARPPKEPAVGEGGSDAPKTAGTSSVATAGSEPTVPKPPPTSNRDAGAACAPDGDCTQPPGVAGTSSPPPPDAGGPIAMPEPVCGNGIFEGDEACEHACTPGAVPACNGAVIRGGSTCQSLGFSSGVLGCASCKLDTRGCGKCGDGRAQEGEDCDGADLQGMNCVGLGFQQGALNCDPNNCRYDTSMCIPAYCFRTRLPCRSGSF
jgi:hypothetical protein